MGSVSVVYEGGESPRKVTLTTPDGDVSEDAVCIGCVMMAEVSGDRQKIKVIIEGGEFSLEQKDTVAFEKWVRRVCEKPEHQKEIFGEALEHADARRFNPSLLYRRLGWGLKVS